jgi:nucleotide-binding universal stress UspA family protein
MNFKTLLVHLDSGPRCTARVAFAARWAKVHGAHVVGLAPTGMADLVLSLNTAVPDSLEYLQLSARFLRSRAEAIAAAFTLQAEALGVVSHEARIVEDEPVAALVRQARSSDLVVVGQSDPATLIDNVAWDFPQQAVMHAGRPVLVVPLDDRIGHAGRKILVAWKDRREAALAIRDALPVLRRAERVVLVEFAEADGPAPDPALVEDVRRWLGRHGIGAEVRAEGECRDPGEALLALAAELDSDLLVMGGYGHSRVREWLLGGVTRHLLGHTNVPVLVSH